MMNMMNPAAALLILMASGPAAVEITKAHRIALEFLMQNPAEAGVDDPATELRKVVERGPSHVSGAIVRFQQLHKGVPIDGTLVVCEIKKDNSVDVRTRQIHKTDVDTFAKVSSERAIAASLDHLGLSGARITEVESQHSELVIVPRRVDIADRDFLAWHVGVSIYRDDERHEQWQVVVDADTGVVKASHKMGPTH